MNAKRAAAAALMALTCATVTVTAASPAQSADEAQRGKYYSSCDKLTKDFKHGVARSKQAADKQVRNGYGRPSYTKKAKSVYKTNKSRLDRDNDGTACER